MDPELDAVIAAPGTTRCCSRTTRLRVLEVILEPEEEEPVHHHRWPSVFVFDRIKGPIHDLSPEGEMLPPNRDVMVALKAWDGQGAWWCTWRPSRPGAS